jgi:hypothetical protein
MRNSEGTIKMALTSLEDRPVRWKVEGEKRPGSLEAGRLEAER